MAARLNAGEVECVAGMDEDFDWEIFEKDGKTPVVLEVNDVIQAHFAASEGGTSTLAFTSAAASANGSSVSKTANTLPRTGYPLHLDGTDTGSWSGVMHLEMNLVDSGDSNRVKQFLRCKIRVLQSQ